MYLSIVMRIMTQTEACLNPSRGGPMQFSVTLVFVQQGGSGLVARLHERHKRKHYSRSFRKVSYLLWRLEKQFNY